MWHLREVLAPVNSVASIFGNLLFSRCLSSIEACTGDSGAAVAGWALGPAEGIDHLVSCGSLVSPFVTRLSWMIQLVVRSQQCVLRFPMAPGCWKL
jgi:hypothetical protein